MNKAVIGLGFGDEGKGATVNYLCSQAPDSLVVRFNGGHQAGHTVKVKDTTHVFSNFGSGTLHGCPTYWSRHCTVEPVGLMNELNLLREQMVSMSFDPKLYIDAECPITTPYDIAYNKEWQLKRKHGTCGVGFGATIEREERFYSLKLSDIVYPPVFRSKLESIRQYYGFDVDLNNGFLKACEDLLDSEYVYYTHELPEYREYIYEGAQGLLLDQHYGFFPHVSRSNCGSTNLPSWDFEYYLVTRAYQTRHGAGFMSNELDSFISKDPLETNVDDCPQGVFRRGLLDVGLLIYAIEKDVRIRDKHAWRHLVITCLDHMERWCCMFNGVVAHFDSMSEYIEFIHMKLRQAGHEMDDIHISEGRDECLAVY